MIPYYLLGEWRVKKYAIQRVARGFESPLPALRTPLLHVGVECVRNRIEERVERRQRVLAFWLIGRTIVQTKTA
jgi:hypothetical protein